MNNPIPRVAAIHDLSGLGRVALMVVIPILSSMGIQVTPLPTAVLSSNTAFDDFKMLDLTHQMSLFIEHWKKENINFDCIYSGFLGSDQQIDIVIDFIQYFNQDKQLVVIDPVLGDNGIAYSPMSGKLIEKMKRLITYADLITPNLTEVCLLLDIPYEDTPSIDKLKNWAKQLAEKGPNKVVITSVREENNLDLTSVIAYSKKTDKFWKVSCTYIPTEYPGTGDIFTSVLTGSLLLGDSLPIALDRAVQFSSLAVRTTFGYDINPNEGVIIERILDSLKAPILMSTYQLI